jgi:hypothetical protein
MHYLFYITGVVLLVLPAGLLGGRRLKAVTLPEVTNRQRHRLGWLHWVNLFDVLRAWGGLTLISRAFEIADPVGSAVSAVPLATTALAALAGLGLQQVFHSTDEDDLVAPVAYASGLTLAFLPPQVALLALPFGLVAALGLKSLAMGFVLTAIASAVLGVLLHLSPLVVGTASLLLFSPALLASMLQRRLVMTVRPRPPEISDEPLRDVPIRVAR